MKRFFVIAVAIMLTACMGSNSLGQTGGGGGGAASGSAGAGGTGASGTSGTGAVAPAPVQAGVGTGQNRVSANARINGNFGINQSPFFADPGVQQQLGLNTRQLNQLNGAYQQALQRYNRSVAGLDANTSARVGTGDLTRTGPNTAAERRAERLQEFQARTNANGTVGTSNAAQQRALQLQRFRERFDTDFNGVVDTTFTDPTMRQRFNQLNLQHQWLDAFNNPQIQQQLDLTAQQRQQLQVLAAEWRNQLRELPRGNRTNLTPEQWSALRNQFMNRLNSVLTPEQEQLWAQLIGPTYNFPITAYVPPINPSATTSRADGVRTVPEGDTTNNPIAPDGGTNRRAQGTGNNSGTVR